MLKTLVKSDINNKNTHTHNDIYIYNNDNIYIYTVVFTTGNKLRLPFYCK